MNISVTPRKDSAWRTYLVPVHEDAVMSSAITDTSVATSTPCIKGSKYIGMLWVFVISSKRLQRSAQGRHFPGILITI